MRMGSEIARTRSTAVRSRELRFIANSNPVIANNLNLMLDDHLGSLCIGQGVRRHRQTDR